MEEVFLAEHLLKVIKERRGRITEMLSTGSPSNYEEYKQLVGNV